MTQRIKDQALAMGFDLEGVAPLQESPEIASFTRWPDAGYAGEMHYLERSIGKTGRMAILPLRRTSGRDLWQLHVLGE